MTTSHALRLPARAAVDSRWMGVLFVLGAVACFSGLDTTSKVIGAVPVMMIVWFRYATQATAPSTNSTPSQRASRAERGGASGGRRRAWVGVMQAAR